MTRKELEERLIDFAVLAIEISESLLKTKAVIVDRNSHIVNHISYIRLLNSKIYDLRYAIYDLRFLDRSSTS